jgi:hypothetical protein
MKKSIKVLLVFSLLIFLMLTFDHKEVKAYQNKYSTAITLDNRTKHNAFDFTMPKDGKIKLNISVFDKNTVPGSLTFAIQTSYSSDSTKIKEITGITSSQGIVDMEIELSKGKYYLYYELNNQTGDLTNTSLELSSKVDILPTIPENISELSTQSITSFEDITKDGYEEIKFGDINMDLVLPFTADQAGGLIIAMTGKAINYDSLKARIYEDAECNKPVGNEFILESWKGSLTTDRQLPKKGTYYIKFTMKSSNPVGITSFNVKLYTISSASRTLVSGKPTVAYQDSDGKKITYKIVVKNSGLLQFMITPYDNTKGGGVTNIQLLDKNKKKITNSDKVITQLNSDGTYDPMIKYYTVTKGTYYLQLSTNGNVYELANYFSEGVSKAGNNKSNSKLLKSGSKAVDGYFTNSDKTTKIDWYKFNVSSSQRIKLTLGYQLDGDIVFEVLDSKGKVLWNSNEEMECLEGYYYVWIERDYAKGTYYVKVYKGSNSSSFTYVIMN